MMGYQLDFQPKLFYHSMNLDERIPANSILRKIRGQIDFDFIYHEVKDRYGEKGNVSVPPPVILKMMLLLILYNVRSEREFMNTLPMRLDWLWFLDYDLDSEIPNHSVLSKARNRWGVEAFQHFFERIVWQCVEAGLVDGSKLFMDSSLVDADASNNSVVKINKETLKIHLVRGFNELESRLEEKDNPADDHAPKSGTANRHHISTTDPDASVTSQGAGKPKLQYKTHRSVDAQSEIITATEITPGEVNEAHLLSTLLSMHQDNTQKTADTVVADTKYGTVENYLACCDLGVNAHIPDLKRTQQERDKRSGIFTEEAFRYDPETDTYVCPGGHYLKKRNYNPKRDAFEYKCSIKICRACSLVTQCTTSQYGRSLKRHRRQEDLDKMRNTAQSQTSKKDIHTRQHLMERSFARATRYGFKRARWRRLWRVRIQEYLTSAIQNIMTLLSYGKERGMAKAFTLPLTKKLSFNLNSLFLIIRAAFYKLCTAPFPSVQRYLYFALSRS
jgi:Transposase and inactivated derivatives